MQVQKLYEILGWMMSDADKLKDEKFPSFKNCTFKKSINFQLIIIKVVTKLPCHKILHMCQLKFKTIQSKINNHSMSICILTLSLIYIHTSSSVDPLRYNMSLLKSEVNLGRKTMDGKTSEKWIILVAPLQLLKATLKPNICADEK